MKSLRTSSTRRSLKLFFLLTALLIVSVLMSIGLGAVSIGPGVILRVLSGAERGTPMANIILLTRLPRTAACLLCGMCLAVSGAVIQCVLANPLAAPNVIGVNAGAGMAVALFCAAFPALAWLAPAAAFLGALAGVLLVLTIGEATGASRSSLVLAGVAVSAIFSAVIDAAVTFVPEALNGYSDFRIGGFSGMTMAKITPAALIALAAMAGIWFLTTDMDVLTLGPEMARSLGMRVRPVRIVLLTCAAALAGAAVSFAGLIGFVGLIVPHIMRRAVGDGSRELVGACALGGAVLVTLCDVLSRTLFAPFELPAGIMLACIGGPFFIFLLICSRGGHSHG